MFVIYSQFGLCFIYLCNKNQTISCFTILTWNRANIAIRGPSSFFVYCCYMARILQIMHKKYSNNHLSCSIILDLGFFSVWWIQILRRSAQMPRTSLKIISMSPAIKAADTFQRHTPETGGKILWSFPLPGPYSKQKYCIAVEILLHSKYAQPSIILLQTKSIFFFLLPYKPDIFRNIWLYFYKKSSFM